MEFTYEGLVRYGFGFQNPNHAAALFAAILPICWGLRAYFEGRRWRYVVMPFELALYLALVLTYSRAGLVAMLAAVLLFYALRSNFSGKAFLERAQVALHRRSLWISVAVFLGGAFYFGAFKRYFLWMLSHDSSVTNRFGLWLGSLRMIAENPRGVGLDGSGRVYTLFYQDEGVNLSYRTLVNSFLTFIAEQGVFVSGLALALALSIVVLSVWNFRSYASKAKIAAISCLSVVWSLSLSGMLSTCLDLSMSANILHRVGDLNAAMQSSLLVLGLGAFLILASLAMPHLRLKAVVASLFCGIAATTLLIGSIWLAGSIGRKGDVCEVIGDASKGKWALIQAGEDRMGAAVLVAPDENSMGIRQTVSFSKKNFKGQNILVPLSGFAGKTPIECRNWLLCGRSVSFLKTANAGVFLLRPVGLPPFEKAPPNLKKVWLDPFDEYGVNSRWDAAAQGLTARIDGP